MAVIYFQVTRYSGTVKLIYFLSLSVLLCSLGLAMHVFQRVFGFPPSNCALLCVLQELQIAFSHSCYLLVTRLLLLFSLEHHLQRIPHLRETMGHRDFQKNTALKIWGILFPYYHYTTPILLLLANFKTFPVVKYLKYAGFTPEKLLSY